MKTFNDYLKWLSIKKRELKTLGGRKVFVIQVQSDRIQITPRSTGKTHFSDNAFAQIVWKRFHTTATCDQFKAGWYVRRKWHDCSNKTCGPWLAAAIRDFEFGVP